MGLRYGINEFNHPEIMLEVAWYEFVSRDSNELRLHTDATRINAVR